MIDKTLNNDVKIKRNDVDFEKEAIEYVYKNRFVRREHLIDYFIKTHEGDTGYTRPSIERKIAQLTKNGSLIIVKYPKLEKYGINDEDKRASYLTVKKIIDTYVYLDTLFGYFKSDEKYDKNSILVEIDLYKNRYPLNKEQLDVLVDHLSTDDEKLLLDLIQILRYYILDKKIEPTDKEKLLKAVNNVLCKFSKEPREYENSITDLISILGHYDDDSVIHWLEHDLKNPNIVDKVEKIRKDYSTIHTAGTIDGHKLELFNLINDLKNDGKEDEAKAVRHVKHEAAKALGHITEDEEVDVW